MKGTGTWVIRRLPLLLLVCGALVKVASIAGVRIAGSQTAFRMAVVYDPLSVWLAEHGVRLAFDQRRIMPSNHEALAFDVLLVLGLALQCFLLGMVLRAIFARRLLDDE